ncbi:MAG: GGDEF domain-containing protein [Schwartzia sp.]|nr:GGDEF domain-containing protein [Schwartzia sp. (in: firmicutes)]
MKQLSFCLESVSEFDAWTQSFLKIYPREARTIFVSVFSGWPDEDGLSELIRRLAGLLPEAVIVGCTSDGEIMSGCLSEKTAIMNFMFFEKTDVRVFDIDFSDPSPEEAAASLVKALKNTDVAGVGLFLSANDEAAHRFLAQLRPLAPRAKVFGGVAGSTEDSGQYVLTGEQAQRHDAVAVAFIGEDLHIQVSTSVGWRPLGPLFRISQMDGDNVIKELDGNPALTIYQKYLGLSSEDINGGSLLFPLCTERNANLVMRLPAACTEDGSLVISGDCREGEGVRLAYGDPSKILDASYNSRNEILSFEPEAILLFNCVSRRFFLRENTNQEILPFQDVAPTAGLYVHGEVNRDEDGNVSLLNMSLVAASFREGPRSESPPLSIMLAPRARKLTDMMKLVQCLAHFVATTSAESEIANQQLAQLATIDRLTGLYNRGEIESILRKELVQNRRRDETLSAIMIDLDNFKSVNDIFGHAAGDDVLRRSAKIIHDAIRRSDAAGRWGGEEFFIILPGTSLANAKIVAERIRAAFASGCVLPNKRSVTGSFGVAQFPDNGDYLKFYQLLDHALYQAKQSGKNCVCVSDEEPKTE